MRLCMEFMIEMNLPHSASQLTAMSAAYGRLGKEAAISLAIVRPKHCSELVAADMRLHQGGRFTRRVVSVFGDLSANVHQTHMVSV